MSSLKRRHFLQFSASALAALGLSQLDIQRQSLRFAKGLAASTPRKLALLVGINNYDNSRNLEGAVTDVYLQKELLVHRFGFKPQDVLIVSDESGIKPTREAILGAFEEHLIKQAKPGDVVVYHFSGHGSQVYDDLFDDNLNSTFLPRDRATSQTNNQKTVSDITGKTLFLLMSALETENVTVVLDSCYSGGGKRGNLTIRSIEGGRDYHPSPIETEYQEKWLSELNLSEQELAQRRQAGIAKGVVIASARKNQIAAEAYLDDFVTGAFTYLMTQYLWQETSTAPVRSIIPNIGRSITNTFTSTQTPEFETKTNSRSSTQPIYFLPQSLAPAEAVITEVNGNRVEFWLGGVSPHALAAFNADATFKLIDESGNEQGEIQLQSRNGLSCTGKVLETRRSNLVKPGALLQERVRVIPADYKLRIGLHESLGSDLNLAKNEIAKLERIEAIPLHTGEVHYILGRITQQQAFHNLPSSEIPLCLFLPLNSIGLYTTEGLEIVPDSFSYPGENLDRALLRLQPKFRSLLAARIMKLTLNADSSRLNVIASLNILGTQETVASQVVPTRTPTKIPELEATAAGNPQINYVNGIPQLPKGTQMNIEVENRETRDLYVTVLFIDPEGNMGVLFPNTYSAAENAALVKAGQTLQIPNSNDTWVVKVGEPLGMVEMLVVASQSPLRKSLQSLQAISQRQGRNNEPIALNENPVDIISDLLQDFDSRNSQNTTQVISTRQQVHLSDTTQLAAMSITYEAVE